MPQAQKSSRNTTSDKTDSSRMARISTNERSGVRTRRRVEARHLDESTLSGRGKIHSDPNSDLLSPELSSSIPNGEISEEKFGGEWQRRCSSRKTSRRDDHWCSVDDGVVAIPRPVQLTNGNASILSGLLMRRTPCAVSGRAANPGALEVPSAVMPRE
jgi:hypothetical protein